jgi:Calcineurin-like phosphoesterase
MKKPLAAILGAVVCLYRCSGSPAVPTSVPGGSGDTPPIVTAAAPVTFVGAGDIADCGRGATLTASLLDRIDGTVYTLGDNAYPNGSTTDYQNCYEPAWGRHRARTRPSPGNHEYLTANAAPYFQYFGPIAGPPDVGYYSFSLGAWHIVSLNSEIEARAGSPQEQWLRADLAANRTRCTAVYWHRALFSSGTVHGGDGRMRDIWRTIYDLDVDLVIAAHDHIYERFAPQDSAGNMDLDRGIRQFVVGTGGGPSHKVGAPRRNSEIAVSTWGVLALTLEADRYQWRFVPAEGGFNDEGITSCH